MSDIPTDGPGSHRSDLAEMRAQATRADAAERECERLRAQQIRDLGFIANALAIEESEDLVGSICAKCRQLTLGLEEEVIRRVAEAIEKAAKVVEESDAINGKRLARRIKAKVLAGRVRATKTRPVLSCVSGRSDACIGCGHFKHSNACNCGCTMRPVCEQ